MKLFNQFCIILLFSVIGEGLRVFLHLPVPGSIIGILLLFAAFETKLIDAKKIEPTCEFLLNNLTILFVPAGVGLMKYYGAIQYTWPILLGIVVVCVVTTLVIVGKTTEFMEAILAKRKNGAKAGARDELKESIIEITTELEDKIATATKGGEADDI